MVTLQSGFVGRALVSLWSEYGSVHGLPRYENFPLAISLFRSGRKITEEVPCTGQASKILCLSCQRAVLAEYVPNWHQRLCSSAQSAMELLVGHVDPIKQDLSSLALLSYSHSRLHLHVAGKKSTKRPQRYKRKRSSSSAGPGASKLFLCTYCDFSGYNLGRRG